jgi:hypothetical protein
VALSIPFRRPGDPDPAGDMDAVVAEVQRLGARVDVPVFDVRAYGAIGDGVNDDTAAIEAALSAITVAGGGVLFLPPGRYLTDGGHQPPPYCHIRGSEPAGRYWGYVASSPPALCALVLRTGTTHTEMLRFTAAYTAGSVQDVTLIGGHLGVGKVGMRFDDPDGEQNAIMRGVGVVGFSGDGVTGRLFVQRWSDCFIGGNGGWGMSCLDPHSWSDTWISSTLIASNALGGVLFDSGTDSGEVHLTSVRVERSGWNTTDQDTPIAVGSPGIRIKGNLSSSTFTDVTTDANSGHGVDIDRTSTARSIYLLQFVGCRFRRDGFGSMAGSVTPTYASVRVRGTSSAPIDNVSFMGCATAYGLARDDGAGPDYLHPKYGLWLEHTNFFSWHGGSIDADHPGGPTYGGVDGWLSNYQPSISTPRLALVLPEWETTDRPRAVGGSVGFATDTGQAELYDGGAWVTLATGADVALRAALAGAAFTGAVSVAGNLRHLSGQVGFFGATAVSRPAGYTQTYSTAARVLPAYTSDPESSAYTGAADGQAKLADLNSLRVAYENLRTSHEATMQVLNSLLDDLQAFGLLA